MDKKGHLTQEGLVFLVLMITQQNKENVVKKNIFFFLLRTDTKNKNGNE
jgi:hypothetical protein